MAKRLVKSSLTYWLYFSIATINSLSRSLSATGEEEAPPPSPATEPPSPVRIVGDGNILVEGDVHFHHHEHLHLHESPRRAQAESERDERCDRLLREHLEMVRTWEA